MHSGIHWRKPVPGQEALEPINGISSTVDWIVVMLLKKRNLYVDDSTRF